MPRPAPKSLFTPTNSDTPVPGNHRARLSLQPAGCWKPHPGAIAVLEVTDPFANRLLFNQGS